MIERTLEECLKFIDNRALRKQIYNNTTQGATKQKNALVEQIMMLRLKLAKTRLSSFSPRATSLLSADE